MKRVARAATSVALIATSALAVGCVEDLKKAQDIERMRLLGLATHVGPTGEEATPLPGDETTLELLVAFPNGQNGAELQVSWFACATIPLATPLESCDEDTFTPIAMDGPPIDTFTVPTEVEGGAPPEGVVVFGIACDGGDGVSLPSDLSNPGPALLSEIRCENARDQEIFTTTIPVRCPPPIDGSDPVGCQRNTSNTRPPPLEITLDGQAWTEETPLEIDTRETHPAKYVVAVAAPTEAAFETYTFRPYQSTATEERTEEILVTFGSDGGRLEAPYRVLTVDETRQDMEYTAPRAETVSPDRMVRFYFVSRDDRGGMRMETRVALVR